MGKKSPQAGPSVHPPQPPRYGVFFAPVFRFSFRHELRVNSKRATGINVWNLRSIFWWMYFPNTAQSRSQEVCLSASNQVRKQQRHLCYVPKAEWGSTGCSVCCWKIQSGVTETCDSVLHVCLVLSLPKTAVEVFRRMILEAEKMDGGVQPGKTSCSMM